MKRSEFLRRLGLGLGTAVVAPSVLANTDLVNDQANTKVTSDGQKAYRRDVMSSGITFSDYRGNHELSKELVRRFGNDDLSGFLQKMSAK